MLHVKKIREEKENKQTNKLMVGLLKRTFGGEQKCPVGNFKLFAAGDTASTFVFNVSPSVMPPGPTMFACEQIFCRLGTGEEGLGLAGEADV